MVDVPNTRVEEVQQRVLRSHPGAAWHGVEATGTGISVAI
jgi:hypothetical protein